MKKKVVEKQSTENIGSKQVFLNRIKAIYYDKDTIANNVSTLYDIFMNLIYSRESELLYGLCAYEPMNYLIKDETYSNFSELDKRRVDRIVYHLIKYYDNPEMLKKRNEALYGREDDPRILLRTKGLDGENADPKFEIDYLIEEFRHDKSAYEEIKRDRHATLWNWDGEPVQYREDPDSEPGYYIIKYEYNNKNNIYYMKKDKKLDIDKLEMI